jgi:hypothetical protein
MAAINWNATRSEHNVISKIVLRVVKSNPDIDAKSLSMDITATHLNGTPMDLKRLLAFDDFNFYHDVYGIMGHIDRTDGKLKRGFLPRCSK